jgi:uncharacterized protein (DUF488 family)
MKQANPKQPPLVLTIGHSTRKLDAFLRLLQAHAVTRLVDVRTITRSRHNPQFNKEDLHKALAEAKIRYQHLPGLGGLRHARVDSSNQGWRNASFRGFADYMQTPKFQKSLGRLLDLLAKDRVVLMCAEAVPWRCHRSLIADALLVRGIQVEHIMSASRTRSHALTPWAKVRGNRITYPSPIERADPVQSARGGNIK